MSRLESRLVIFGRDEFPNDTWQHHYGKQMIIPKIKFNSEVETSILVDQLMHWSLFGQVALTNVGPDSDACLEQVVKRVGGFVDLAVELTEPSQRQSLELLNAGATWILHGERTVQIDSIPQDRLLAVMNDSSPDEAVPPGHVLSLDQATAERMAELEMARVDCLVNAEQLTPELITGFLKTVLITDRPDGLWSTVIVDPLGIALGLAYSNEESLLHAIEHRCGTYWSRSRDGLWVKGETSGATQQLLGIRLDCDRDCLRFTVTQDPPGFCHRNMHTCFGQERTIQSVMERLLTRIGESDETSFTYKLANDSQLLETKLVEEAKELAEASQSGNKHEIAFEAADVLYFSLVAMSKNGVTLDRVYHELARRMNRVVRRGPGIKKES